MAKSNMYDKLIEMVKSNPVLYNVSHPDYKNLVMKNKLWEDIGQVLNLSGEDAKGKWKNARDTYSRYLKTLKVVENQRSSQNIKRYGKWQWASSMEFLREHIGTTSNDETETESKQSKSSEQNNFKSNRSILISKRKKALELQRSDERVNYDINSKTDNLTSTEHIMLGYAKIMDSFSKPRNIVTKMRIAKIIMDAELEEVEENERTAKPLNSTEEPSGSQSYNVHDPLSLLKQFEEEPTEIQIDEDRVELSIKMEENSYSP